MLARSTKFGPNLCRLSASSALAFFVWPDLARIGPRFDEKVVGRQNAVMVLRGSQTQAQQGDRDGSLHVAWQDEVGEAGTRSVTAHFSQRYAQFRGLVSGTVEDRESGSGVELSAALERWVMAERII